MWRETQWNSNVEVASDHFGSCECRVAVGNLYYEVLCLQTCYRLPLRAFDRLWLLFRSQRLRCKAGCGEEQT